MIESLFIIFIFFHKSLVWRLQDFPKNKKYFQIYFFLYYCTHTRAHFIHTIFSSVSILSDSPFIIFFFTVFRINFNIFTFFSFIFTLDLMSSLSMIFSSSNCEKINIKLHFVDFHSCTFSHSLSPHHSPYSLARLCCVASEIEIKFS